MKMRLPKTIQEKKNSKSSLDRIEFDSDTMLRKRVLGCE